MSDLTLDYANCLSDRIGEHGLDPQALDAAGEHLADVTDRLESTRGSGWERWRLLAEDPMRGDHLRAVQRLVERHRPVTDNLVVLGIGGSALGNIALHAALAPSTHNLLPAERRDGPRVFVLDNVDPTLVADTMDLVETLDPGLGRTLVNVISKSGETAETAAQFLVLRDRLVRALGARHADRVVAVTDPVRGTMRSICDEAGYETLPVPEGVGGRFSVLSPVGLFSAAMGGIDVAAMLDGAAAMEARCRRRDHLENPAAVLAWLLVEHFRRGRINHVLMPYANGRDRLGDWFRQLWAESLGKATGLDGSAVHAGPTPIRALGATDQHSQIQLYREGPFDKVVGLVAVDAFQRDLEIPAGLDAPALTYLQGRTLGELLDAERRATTYALVESGRPNFTLRLPRIDARSVGAFIQLWQVTTAYAGAMLGIDPYDQPAVETGKVATFGLMGRAGYGEWIERVDAALTAGDRTV